MFVKHIKQCVAYRCRYIAPALASAGNYTRYPRCYEHLLRLHDVHKAYRCAYDEFGELVDLTGTGLDAEYDAEVFVEPSGQLRLI